MSGGGSELPPPSMPPPRPRSPPRSRLQFAKKVVLEREVGFLEDELKFHEGLQPASLSCKEVTDFVLAKSDPLVPLAKKSTSRSRLLKSLCCMPRLGISWIFCGCERHNVEMPKCLSSSSSSSSCSIYSDSSCSCMKKPSSKCLNCSSNQFKCCYNSHTCLKENCCNTGRKACC